MAGSDPRFDPARFQTAITGVQKMALPPDEADQPLFFGPDQRQWDTATSAGYAWDPRAPGDLVDEDVPAPVGVAAICGITVLSTQADETAMGRFVPIALRLSFMPAEWAKVSDFVRMRYGGLDYERGATLPPRGLFEVGKTVVDVRAPDAGRRTS